MRGGPRAGGGRTGRACGSGPDAARPRVGSLSPNAGPRGPAGGAAPPRTRARRGVASGPAHRHRARVRSAPPPQRLLGGATRASAERERSGAERRPEHVETGESSPAWLGAPFPAAAGHPCGPLRAPRPESLRTPQPGRPGLSGSLSPGPPRPPSALFRVPHSLRCPAPRRSPAPRPLRRCRCPSGAPGRVCPAHPGAFLTGASLSPHGHLPGQTPFPTAAAGRPPRLRGCGHRPARVRPLDPSLSGPAGTQAASPRRLASLWSPTHRPRCAGTCPAPTRASRPRSFLHRLALGGLPPPRVDPDPAAGAWWRPPVRGFPAVRAVVTAPSGGLACLS